MLLISANFEMSRCGEVIRIFLYLSSSPEMIVKSDLGKSSVRDKNLINSALARPFCGGELTLILRYSSPIGSVKIPMTLQTQELGVSLTLKIVPCLVAAKNIYPAMSNRKLLIRCSTKYKASNKINGAKSMPENSVGIFCLILL